ncbi:MAG: hypothetical protein HFE52_01420 [Clostridia bacterium]|nr:hypothetical protein [Clostridia bacterium]
MRILIKSLSLFVLGIYIDICKKRFDSQMDKCIKNGGDISSPSLSKRSNHCYDLYVEFREREKMLRREISVKSLVKKNI